MLGAPGAAPQIWGVLNVTPDSFSDGGEHLDPTRALARAMEMLAAGAHVIDVGGASSRPPGATYGEGAAAVTADQELSRVLPVVEALAAGGARVSIDTTSAEVAEHCLRAGARIVNDVSMGRSDALVLAVAAHEAELVLMHTRDAGRVSPETTAYGSLLDDVLAELEGAVARASGLGVPRARIWIDPGIGFAKTASQSAALLAATPRLVATGHRVLIGASRKSFLARLAPRADGTEPGPRERLAGSLAALTTAVLGGAHAIRVHDVAESLQAARVAHALRGAGGGSGA